MKRIGIAILFTLTVSGCSGGCADIFAPNQSAAITNREMLEEAQKQTAELDSIKIELRKLNENRH